MKEKEEKEVRLEHLELVGCLWKDPRGAYIPFVKREFWGAAPPTAPPKPLGGPILCVRFCHTYTPMWFWPHSLPELRDLQDDQMKLEELTDIAYNFLIGADGTLYEGRGWKAEPHRPPGFEGLKGKRCLDIAYIGDFQDQCSPPWLMVNVGLDLIKYGIRSKLIDPLVEVIPYNKFSLE